MNSCHTKSKSFNPMQQEKFDIWCLVELFGHSRIAGRVQEKTIGGAAFLQIDVPETDHNPAFTRILNPSAVYALNPVTEDVARHYANNLNSQPINAWDVKEFMKKSEQRRLAAAQTEPEEHDYSDEREEEDDDELPI